VLRALPLSALLFASAASADGTAGSIVEVEEIDQARRVAVRDLEVDGVNPRLARVASDALVAELRKYRRVSVIGMDELRVLLEQEVEKQIAGCDEESACLAELTEALGADVLVTGSVALVGEETVVAIRRLNQRTAKGITATRRVKARAGEEVIEVIGDVVAELFKDRRLRDGEQVGVDLTVVQRLNPPPLDPWVVWSGLGVSGALLAVGAVAGGVNIVAADAWDRQTGDVSQATLDDQSAFVNGAGTLAIAGLSASAATLALSGVAAAFTDWEGLRASVE
jgi:hypothetical protein